MKSKLFLVALFATLILSSCGSNQKKKTEDNTATETAVKKMEVDSLLAQAETLIDQEVTVQGFCTHLCAYGASKLFMMGSDSTKSIRVEAAALGSFDAACANSMVEVKGILKEQRIDEAYLQEWEAKLAAGQTEKHGDGKEGGCASEKNARQETANTPEARIADFRAKIAQREAETGKAYLSFYYVEAKSYEIQ